MIIKDLPIAHFYIVIARNLMATQGLPAFSKKDACITSEINPNLR